MVDISSKKEGCNMEESKEDKTKEIKMELKRRKSELNNLQDEINSLNMELKTRNVIIQDLTGQITEKQTELLKTVKIVEALQTSLEQKRKEMDEKNKDLFSVKTELLSKKEECNMLYDNLESRNMIIEDLAGQLTDKQAEFLETVGSVNKLPTEQKEINEKIDFDLIAVNLPRGEIDFVNQENIRPQPPINPEKRRIEGKIGEKIQLIKQQFKDIQSETIRLQSDLEKTLEDIESHNTINEDINKELRANKAALNWFNNELKAKEEMLRLKDNEIGTLRDELENKTNVNLENNQQEIETLNEDLKVRNMIIENLNNQLTERQIFVLNKTKTAEKIQRELNQSNQELTQRINTIAQLQKELDQSREKQKSITSKFCREDDVLTNIDAEQKNQINPELKQETVIEQNQNWNNNVALHDNIDKTLEIDEASIKTKKWKNQDTE